MLHPAGVTAMDWHFCAVCMGQGRLLEPASPGYSWLLCQTCIGVGQVPGTTPFAA